MNYQKIYNDLVLKAKLHDRRKLKRNDPNFIYYENHHIIPVCLDGTDNKENKVLLTAREHFVAHKLLIEIYPNNKKLLYTIFYMSHRTEKVNKRLYRVSSREYERYKLEVSEILKNRIVKESTKLKLSNSAKGRKLSEETKLKIRQNLKKRPPVSQETREKLRITSSNKHHTEEAKERIRQAQKRIKPEDRFNYGKHLSEETKEKIKQGNLGQKRTQETIENIRKVNIGRKLSPITIEKMSYFQKNRVKTEKELLFFKGLNKGRVHSEQSKENMSISHRGTKNHNFGKHFSEDTKRKMNESNKNKPIVICPYCGFKSTSRVCMNRWHFDNCKQKPRTL